MTGFLNKERYVKVSDLKLGQPGTYTDYEELVFMYKESDWVTDLTAQVKSYKLTNDQNELVFYNSIHILNSIEEVVGKVTEHDVTTVLESSVHMLVEVLTSEWVIRSDKFDG